MQLFDVMPERTEYGKEMSQFIKGALRKEIKKQEKKKADLDNATKKVEPTQDCIDATAAAKEKFDALHEKRKEFIVRAFRAIRAFLVNDDEACDGCGSDYFDGDDYKYGSYFANMADHTKLKWSEINQIYDFGKKAQNSNTTDINFNLTTDGSGEAWGRKFPSLKTVLDIQISVDSDTNSTAAI